MRKNDKALTPAIDYTGTKTAVEAYPNPTVGMRAVSTDTGQEGFYSGSIWVWGTGDAHTHSQSAITNLVTDLAGKQGTLVSTVNIKSINGNSILGAGNLTITGGSGGGAATDLAYSLLVHTSDITIPSGYFAYVADYIEIASGVNFEISLNSIFEIG